MTITWHLIEQICTGAVLTVLGVLALRAVWMVFGFLVFLKQWK